MIGLLCSHLHRRPWLAAMLLVGGIAGAYANASQAAFVWDDIPSIVENFSIAHWATVLEAPAAVNTTSGRPLVSLSLGLNYALGGRDPAGFHVFNVLVHAAAALVLFGFVRRLALLPRWTIDYGSHATGLALSVATLWALHPLQTQAVTYVIQRAESLMGLCYLLTLWLFLRAEDATRPGLWRALAVLACALGMLAKEVMVSVPVVVLLFDRTFLAGSFRRALTSKKRFYSALFATWLILFWLVATLGGNRDGSTGGLSTDASWGRYWLTQFPAIATYLKLTFWPHPLIFQYGTFWLPNGAAAVPGALVVVPLVGLTLVALVRWPAPGFFGFWFWSILSVTSLVPGTVDMIVEHRMYVALAPLWILLVAGLFQIGRTRMYLGVVAIAVACGVLTVARNRDYRSPLALWTDNVAKRPDNALAQYNLATDLLQQRGHESEAQRHLEIAVRLAPDFASAHYNLALVLSRQPDRQKEAMAQFEEVIRIAPGHAQAHANLAVLLGRQGQLPAACRHLQLAVQHDPRNRMAWLALVQTLEALHRSNDAVQAAMALVQAHPDFAEGQAALGVLLALRHDDTAAIPRLETALRLDPAQSEARYYLGVLLVQRGERLPDAIALLEDVVHQRPELAGAHYNLGVAYLASGNRLSDAIAQFSAAVRLDPRDANAHFNLAGAMEASGGDLAQAIIHYRAAAGLQPDVPLNHFRLARLLAANPQTRSEARAEVRQTLTLDPAFPGARALLDEIDAVRQ